MSCASQRIVRSEAGDDLHETSSMVNADDDDEVKTRIEIFDFVDGDDDNAIATTRIVVVADSDGDSSPPRRRRRRQSLLWNIVWKSQTDVAAVGLQLWRGCFAMLDFVLSRQSPLRSASTVLELGCGVGLLGLALARLGNLKRIVLTDALDECLELCRRNLLANNVNSDERIEIARLDWNDEIARNSIFSPAPSFDVVIAADCVYEPDSTDGLIHCLLQCRCDAYLTIERRIVFTTERLMAHAPAYDYFVDACAAAHLDIETIDLASIPQLLEYDRTDIVLLKLSRQSTTQMK